MTKRDIAALASRVLAVYTFVTCLSLVRLPPQALAPGAAPALPPAVILGYMLTPLLLLGLSLALWFGADAVGGWMTSGTAATGPGAPADAATVRSLAYFVIGLFLAASAAPQLVQAAVGLVVAAGNPKLKAVAGQNLLFALSGAGVQVLLGAWLMRCGRGPCRHAAGS